jgi:peptidoglycan/xylan/chitin deacetylase (PgdA/CDA1 family)
VKRPRPDDVARWLGRSAPRPALEVGLGAALAGLGVSLCLHRVGTKRATDWQPGLCSDPGELDALLELLLTSRPGSAANWLSLSFDDGYRDAAEYIRTRAPRFPAVEFFFFVCPEKLERRAGFRWDLVEQRLIAGERLDSASALLDDPHRLERENGRPELHALAAAPGYELATVDEARALQGFHNVRLGNHSNLHASPVRLPDDEAARDYRASRDDFERLFGPQRHFAFPFGTPVHHFQQRHVDALRALGDFTIWTTESRPYRLTERRPGAVLPRFPVNGDRSPAELAGWLAARAMDFRVRGTKHHF